MQPSQGGFPGRTQKEGKYMKGKWFEKYVGCAFNISGKEVIFAGTCENPNSKNGLPLQYVFEPGNIVIGYKDARCIMGAMIDKYSY